MSADAEAPIWSGGRIRTASSLSVSAADRAFEHGLGLFETLRTWQGRAVLLDRHLNRLRASAQALGLKVNDSDLPDARAVDALRHASGIDGDVTLRILLTGGTVDAPGTVWMRCGPLPPRRTSLDIGLCDWIVDQAHPLARHKCLNYWDRRIAYERALSRGQDEALILGPAGSVWESTRMNVFAVVGRSLKTPGPDGPFVPGIMRKLVLERCGDVGLEPSETMLTVEDLRTADEVFLTNSVRGLVPVRRIAGQDRPTNGPWTSRLIDAIARHLGAVTERT